LKIHPHDLLLRSSDSALLRDKATLVAHLKECRRCCERAAILRERQPGATPEELARIVPWPEVSGQVYGSAFEAAERRFQIHSRTLGAERSEAPARMDELMRQPPQRRELLLRNHPRFQTWGLLERLIEHSLDLCFSDPISAETLARLAVCLSDSLDQDFYGPGRLADLRARAWGYVGNARRIQFQLDRAEEAFAEATKHLGHGTGDVLEKALLLPLIASLRRAQRRFLDAERLLLRAFHLYRQVGEAHGAGRALVSMSPLYMSMGTPERSIPLLRESLGLIDENREPRLAWCAHHNLIDSLAETGRLMEAHRLFIQARPLYDRFPDTFVKNRRNWIVGRIAYGLGQAKKAEVHFLKVRLGLISEGAVYDTAFVSLKLAALYAEWGRTAELNWVSDELSAIFSSGKIPREALAALMLSHSSIVEKSRSK